MRPFVCLLSLRWVSLRRSGAVLRSLFILPLLAIFAAFISFAVFALPGVQAATGAPKHSGDVQIDVLQLGNASVRVVFETSRSKRMLRFRHIPAGHRERRWNVETSGFELVRTDDGDFLQRTDGKRFKRVAIIAKPDLFRLKKNYQPLSRYGEGGVLFYTGHFWPVTNRDVRTNAVFTFLPLDGSKVVAFGERTNRLERWRSPLAHPAFVYLGPVKPVESNEAVALVDPAVPSWIRSEFKKMTPQIFDYLADQFGFSHDTKPNLFLTALSRRGDGRLNFSGDALPMQFQVTLVGGGWQRRSDSAVSTFRHSTTHEVVHLWQSGVRSNFEENSAWIHEGAADAIASEAMVALGYWAMSERDQFFAAAKAECADRLAFGSLDTAIARGHFRALYACGHVVAVAVARAEGRRVSDFWRDLIIEAKAEDGYSRSLYLRFVEHRTGRPGFADRVKLFASTPHGDPAGAIERLLGAAEAPLARGAVR